MVGDGVIGDGGIENGVSKSELNSLHDQEIARGWGMFLAKYPHPDIEKELLPFLSAEVSGDWLRKARVSSLLSMKEMARRLGITTQSYHRMENGVTLGEITLKTLSRCAEAMDCEVVYAIRPKWKLGFAEIIWKFLLTFVQTDEKLLRMSGGNRGVAIAKAAERLLYNPKFRKARGWAKNSESAAHETINMLALTPTHNCLDEDVWKQVQAEIHRRAREEFCKRLGSDRETDFGRDSDSGEQPISKK